MYFIARDLGPTTRAARYGYPYAIELSRRNYWKDIQAGDYSTWAREAMLNLGHNLQERYGRSYRAYWKRPNRRARYYFEQRETFMRICFRNESLRTLALLELSS